MFELDAAFSSDWSGSTINLTSNIGTLLFSVGGDVALDQSVSFASTTLALGTLGSIAYLATPPTGASAFAGSAQGTLDFTPGWPTSSLTLTGVADAADVLNLTELPGYSVLASTLHVSPVNSLFAMASGSGDIMLDYNVVTHVLSGSGSGMAAYAYDFGYWATTTVPLPATVWLLGSALLGLIGLRQRRLPAGA